MENKDIEYYRERAKFFSTLEIPLGAFGLIIGFIGIFTINLPLIIIGCGFIVSLVVANTIANKNRDIARKIEKDAEEKRLFENRTANLLAIRAKHQSECQRISKPEAPLQISCDGNVCDFWLDKDKSVLYILQRLDDAESKVNTAKADTHVELYYKDIPVSEIRYFTYRALNTGRLLTDIVLSANETITVSEDAYNELVCLLPEKELKTQKPTVVQAQNTVQDVIPSILMNIHVCPKCGSQNTRVITGTDKMVSTVAFGVLAANKLINQYICNNCKHKFS